MTQPIARGLNNFISEIRNSPDKDAEVGFCRSWEICGNAHDRSSSLPHATSAVQLKRVEKELAHIRQKFTGSEKLNS
jgi:hypothetical protein